MPDGNEKNKLSITPWWNWGTTPTGESATVTAPWTPFAPQINTKAKKENPYYIDYRGRRIEFPSAIVGAGRAAPTGTTSDADQAAYATYVQYGGTLSIGDWLAKGKPPMDTPIKPLSYEEALADANRFGGKEAGYVVERDSATGDYNAVFYPQLVTKPSATYPLEQGQSQTWTDTSNGKIWTWDVDTNGYVQTGYDPAQDQSRQPKTPEPISPYEQAELDQRAQLQGALIEWQRQQQQMQLEAEKQARLAQLRANPASWLEYASLAGETPAIQPWMLPLMPQQYQGAQAGQALPGWTPSGSLSGLPELTTPSMQYQARIGPTSQQQYGGYQQARTAATPEETQWRNWMTTAPPSGQYRGLRRQR